MDAVRWVLGESRASELRGESMKDVIFNGTTTRKPAGRASVELIFDNSDGRIGGQWAKYTELAVRRVLTREGGSTYSINGTTVRRRDIQDIFLGTGLGPRAYAIIGQGMISRIIEARPEELRTFLEEAAGVSKYKERRRETARRLEDSQENLNRVLDILAEQEQQLEKLTVQAAEAKKYQTLSERRDRQQQFLWLIQKQMSEKEQETLSRQADKARTELENIRMQMVRCDGDLNRLRITHEEANSAVHEAQGALYAVNAEIGSLKAQIDYIADTKKRLESQLAAFEAQKVEWQNQMPSFMTEISEVAEKCIEQQVLGEAAEERLAMQQGDLPELEKDLAAKRQEEQQFKVACQDIQRQIAVAANTHKNLRDALDGLFRRRESLVTRRQALAVPDKALLAEHLAEREETTCRLEETVGQLQTLEARLPKARQTVEVAQNAVSGCREALVKHESRLAALRQVAEKAAGRGQLGQWLKDNGLDAFTPFWRQVTCNPTWEAALEVVLQERMQAIELSNLSWADGLSKGRLPGKLVFFSSMGAQGEDQDTAAGLVPLVSFVSASRDDLKAVLQSWLSGIYTKTSLAEAIQDRAMLPEGASFVVPEGHRVDRYSVRLFAAESENEGFFQRINEIARLESQGGDLEAALKAATDKAHEASQVLKERQEALERFRRDRTVLTEKLGEIRLVILKEEERQRHYAEQQEQIALGFETIDAECREKQEEMALHEQLLEELDGRLSEGQEKEDAFHLVVDAAEEKLLKARETCHAIEKQLQQALFAQQTLKRRSSELERQVEFAKGQVAKAEAGMVSSRAELGNLEAGVQESALQQLLEKRLSQERLLAEKREALESVAQSLREAMEKRMQLESQLQPQQEQIVALQLKEQEARLNASQQAEKLADAGVDEAELAKVMPENARASSLQGEVTRLTNEINAMGLVNLAAAQELEEGKKRRQYLKEQHQDLTDAIVTLEDAIKRIDRETRHQIKDTFDRVNTSLDELFPILFGGGKAQLIMSGDEILDAGIQIMAQPPGKKNATIHLLSGGEKALTALALVFSLFQLNPAPFCLLDEVDAPLDDANTARFSSLVEKMSEQTQFLFISHNQIAMAMAEELIGVTMQEKGVSRIVSVDLDKAGEFAEKGHA